MLVRCLPMLLAAVVLTACDRERREPRAQPLGEGDPIETTTTQLFPGSAPKPIPDERRSLYEGSAYHLSEGQRLYRWFNCVGCHANGGGGSGPALMDDVWLYGGELEQIYATIMQGRPNGMPSFRRRIPEQQVWQIAAYVRSMSGNVPKDAAPGRADRMSVKPPESRSPELPAKPAGAPGASTGSRP
jgi:cytochrome c oxidase cbb3-type subunit 3